MGLRLYLFGLISTIMTAIALWLLLLFNVNPYQAPVWIIFTFYFTLFFFFWGIFAIIFFYFKVWLSNREVVFAHLAPSLRQAAIFSLIIAGLLLLQQIKALNLWIAFLFILSLLMLELFFRSKK